ncbi:Inner kinetochore subunit cnl2 [Schizosaccharomyces pombe]
MEEQILNDYLLSQGRLQSIISLEQWRQLFPQRYREDPLIERLYEYCTQQRQKRLAKLRANIHLESQVIGKSRIDRMLATNVEKLQTVSHASTLHDVEEFYTSHSAKPLDISEINERLSEAVQSAYTKLNEEKERCTQLTLKMNSQIASLSDFQWSKEPNLDEPIHLLESLIESLEKAAPSAIEELD